MTREPSRTTWFRGLILVTPVVVASLMTVSDVLTFLLRVDAIFLFHAASLLLVPAVALLASYLSGWRFVAGAFFVLFFGGLAIEVLGTRTGFPFGAYAYTGRFQPEILGVPVQVLLGWFILGVLCYSIGNLSFESRLKRVVAASALMVSWDLLYDPLFTKTGMWTWERGEYFGVPVSNFLGWLIVSILLFVAVSKQSNHSARPRLAPRLTLSYVYLSYAVDGTVRNTFADLALAALIGASFMVSALVVANLPDLSRRNQRPFSR